MTSRGATAIDCRYMLLRSESGRLEIVGIGLENVMAIAVNDAVLVADMRRAQDVKKAVEAVQAIAFHKDYRPGGWFESPVVGGRFQVKRIMVHPGASLNLQCHHHRSEH